MQVIIERFESVMHFMVDHPEQPIGDIESINHREIPKPTVEGFPA